MKKIIVTFLILLFSMSLISGCTQHVFHKPMAISTKSAAAKNIKPLQLVSTEQKTYFFILFPIITPVDPRDIWDNLLAESKKVGGNSVIDVQFRGESSFLWAFPMLGAMTCKATGTAAIIE